MCISLGEPSNECMRGQRGGAFHLGSHHMNVSLGKPYNELGRLNKPPSGTAKDAWWARPSNDAAVIYTSSVAHDII